MKKNTNSAMENLIQSDAFRKKKLQEKYERDPFQLEQILQNKKQIELFPEDIYPCISNKIPILTAIHLLKEMKIFNICCKCKTSDCIMHMRKRNTKNGKKGEPYRYCIHCKK